MSAAATVDFNVTKIVHIDGYNYIITYLRKLSKYFRKTAIPYSRYSFSKDYKRYLQLYTY